ncbi:MAG: 2-aminobenzoate-CoA ligase, partial [Alphaproteobacteria bacterium]|nr:2-aminobenzoate-CoA ligase [Alphaproteobacteria bacterium]
DRIARLLVEEERLAPGNRVLLRGANSAFLYAAWFGVLKAGGVVVATMPMLRARELATILDRAEISHAIVDRATLGDFEAAALESGSLRALLVYEGDSGDGPLETRLGAVAPGFASADTARDEPALIAFTSGTTGNPKGCVHFHRDILAAADGFARHILAPGETDVHCGSPPIAFTFGLGGLVIFPFRFRGATVPVALPGPAALLDSIERHRVTILYTAPTAYKAMLALLPGRDLSSLRACVSAGEHLPADTWSRWREATGIPIVDGIGATEMMHIFISASGDDIRPGATGKAVPGYSARVLGPDGEALATGTGRLAVKGPTGCRYLDDTRQADYVQHGWNVTGDTYRVDEDGYFWFVARSDDMIVSSGYNISAPEVEEALLTHPAVSECAVIGVPDPERGSIVKAFVVVEASWSIREGLAGELQDHAKKVIAPYKYPRAIAFVDALPRTATGKLQRFALRAVDRPAFDCGRDSRP